MNRNRLERYLNIYLTHRYIAVTQPIKYAKHKSNARVWMMIGVAWLVSGAIGSPIVLGLNNTPDRSPNQCLFNNTDYVIYSSLGSFYIPCIIMMFLYFNIFKVNDNFHSLDHLIGQVLEQIKIKNVNKTVAIPRSSDQRCQITSQQKFKKIHTFEITTNFTTDS